MNSNELLKAPVQIGTMSLRDPEDSKKISEHIPLYAEGTPTVLPIDAAKQKRLMQQMYLKMRAYYERQNN